MYPNSIPIFSHAPIAAPRGGRLEQRQHKPLLRVCRSEHQHQIIACNAAAISNALLLKESDFVNLLLLLFLLILTG
jgi:hypothetical protein